MQYLARASGQSHSPLLPRCIPTVYTLHMRVYVVELTVTARSARGCCVGKDQLPREQPDNNSTHFLLKTLAASTVLHRLVHATAVVTNALLCTVPSLSLGSVQLARQIEQLTKLSREPTKEEREETLARMQGRRTTDAGPARHNGATAASTSQPLSTRATGVAVSVVTSNNTVRAPGAEDAVVMESTTLPTISEAESPTAPATSSAPVVYADHSSLKSPLSSFLVNQITRELRQGLLSPTASTGAGVTTVTAPTAVAAPASAAPSTTAAVEAAPVTAAAPSLATAAVAAHDPVVVPVSAETPVAAAALCTPAACVAPATTASTTAIVQDTVTMPTTPVQPQQAQGHSHPVPSSTDADANPTAPAATAKAATTMSTPTTGYPKTLEPLSLPRRNLLQPLGNSHSHAHADEKKAL